MSKVEIILFDSYLQAIKNSVGSNIFRNFYAYVDGEKKDIREDGRLSCASFVSSILYLHKLCFDVHARTEGLIKDMEKFGWEKIEEPKPGAVIVWENDDQGIPHVGFYIGDQKAISTSKTQKHPIEHHWTFGETSGQPNIKVEAIYWHKQLDKNEMIKKYNG